MKQVQKTTTAQKLSLTQLMRSSLSLLQMGAVELTDETEKEAKRNPFLKPIPSFLSGGGAVGPNVFDLGNIGEQQSENDKILKQVSLIEVVSILQKSVEPAGLFAWSLKDCFRIQLEANNRYDPVIAKLLDRIDLVAQQKIQDICTLCGVDNEDAVEMLADIRLLSPAPLQPVAMVSENVRTPELIFSLEVGGIVKVRLNETALPRMLTDDGLFSTIQMAETDKNAMAYYRDCYRGAAAFVLAMQKRANTLLKIGQIIARTQAKFIRTGHTLDRRPLTMAMLATELGLNKSTISRALSNCLFDTDRGVVNPIDCFVRPLNEKGADRTREQVLQRLSLLIRTENKTAPLSDEVLAGQLASADLKISRRTVAKYRGILSLQGAYQRKSHQKS